MKRFSRVLSSLLGCAAVMLGAPAHADDSEVFTNTAFLASGVRPNVLFIIDTSGSMDTKVNVYDANTDYTSAGVCPAGRVYWSTNNTSVPPDCNGNQWVAVDNNRCRAATNGMNASGWWRGRTQMLIKTGNPTYWGDAVAGRDWKLECESDRDVHGDLPGTTAPGAENKRARNGTGTADANRWGNATSSQQVNWGTKQRISYYSSNYVNWYYSLGTGIDKTRLDVVKEVATSMIDTLDGVNLGIMRYSTTAQGGMVLHPVSEITAASRTSMKALVNGFIADGFTPLSETLYEAHQYLAGTTVTFGNLSRANGALTPSVAASRVGNTLLSNTYDGPMDFSCQNTYVVYLTDGLPTEDNAADTAIETLAGTSCPAQIDNPDPSYPTSGRCLESLARYMHETDLRTDVTGDQKVVTYMIGFGDDIASSAQFMEDVATAGGGTAYTTGDAGGLTATLEEIFSQVQDEADTTFVAPTVSVNAFNRSQNLNELFMSVFAPSKLFHWNGNLKKYRIYQNDIYGPDGGTPAVDPATGFFADGSQAVNSDGVVDGPAASMGGAAHSLPNDPDTRNVYTYLGTNSNLTVAANAVTVANVVSGTLTPAMVGAADAAEAQLVVDFARGRDLYDDDTDGDTTEAHHRMGDPMHARPAIVIHGGTAAAPVGTVFVPTNDGMLHAFDMNPITGDPDASGDVPVTPTTERWTFVPAEYLPRLGLLYDNAPTATRDYALDGDVRVFKYDVNQNGTIEASDGDKVYLFFGTGRGGSTVYSLDVTDVNTPKFRWKKTFTDTGLSRLGKTWSAPVIARVNTGGTQNDQKLVLIFGGGYDPGQDSLDYSADSVGNAIYMLDLETGNVVWSASGTGGGGTFTNAKMTHAFPSNINVMDTNGDGLADRMYASDMGGQVWRFDIWNRPSAQPVVTGGVFASLGGAFIAPAAVTRAQNRRLYYAPDVAPITVRGSRPFMNIGIGSGYRGHPLNKETQDRFYSIRDYLPFTPRDQNSYNTATVIRDVDLVDVTTNANATITDAELGWKIRLAEGGTTWRGEKVLAESITAGGVIFFTTFTPLDPDPGNPCLSRSLNRVYAVFAANGRPFVRWSESGTGALTTDDRYIDLAQKGIAPGVTILSNPTDPSGMGICQVGAKILNRCVKFGSAVRSFWERE